MLNDLRRFQAENRLYFIYTNEIRFKNFIFSWKQYMLVTIALETSVYSWKVPL